MYLPCREIDSLRALLQETMSKAVVSDVSVLIGTAVHEK